jgi:anti-sigma factor (TIGR02949 family)
MAMPENVDSLSCAKILDQLEAHLDGDLPPEVVGSIEAHLSGCQSCSTEHDLAASIRAELRQLPHFDAPDELIEAVRREAGAHPPVDMVPTRGSRTLSVPIRAGLAIAAALVFGIAAILLRPDGPSETPSVDPVVAARVAAEARFAFSIVVTATHRTGVELQREVFAERVLAPAIRSLSLPDLLMKGSSNEVPLPPEPTPSPVKEV